MELGIRGNKGYGTLVLTKKMEVGVHGVLDIAMFWESMEVGFLWLRNTTSQRQIMIRYDIR